MFTRGDRDTLLLALLAVIAVGAASRLIYFNSILIDKYLGDALYAVMFYLFLSLLWPQGTPVRKAVLVLLAVIVIELFQLTAIPLAMRRSDNLGLQALSVMLGTKFSWWDMAAYVVGVAGIYAIDLYWLESGNR